jgi:hypothetical protein
MSQTEPRIAHMVYFTLKDPSPSGIERQLAACRKYLTGHPGTEVLAFGTRNPDLKREVNDTEFHVAVHVVFGNRAAHDTYQTHERHLKFIEESKPHWVRARVFDADVT